MKIDWYRVLPQYMFQEFHTDWVWDELLNDILDNVENIQTHAHSTKLDKVEVWTSNWPYAYGSAYNITRVSGLPSVKTRKRLKSVVEEAKRKSFVEAIEKLRNK